LIFRRILLVLSAAAMIAAAAAVLVFALAFGLYALLEPLLGRAGAAGAVALSCALFMGFSGLLLALSGRRKPPPAPEAPDGFLARALGFVKNKPVLAATAAIGAGVMAARNPKYLGAVLRAFIDGSAGVE
jgi:hypothetical protein